MPILKGLKFSEKIGRQMYTYFFTNPCITRV
nr:MAG TPA: hypothetical protein [Caudoviricetes sp.]